MMTRTARDPDASTAWLLAFYEATSLGVLVLKAGTVIAANAAAAQVISAGEETLVGRPWPGLCQLTGLDGADLPQNADPVLLATRARRPCQSTTLGLQGAGGPRRLVQIEAIPILAEEGLPAQVVCVIAAAREHAGDAILYDPLTGLAGDALFRDRLGHGLATAQRAHWPMALLLAGFEDGARNVGQFAADRLLQEVSRRLRQTLRDSDTVARLGDHLFGMLLPATDPAGAVHAARRLWSALQQPYFLEGERLGGGAGIGIAVYPDHGKDAAALLGAAEAAREAARRNGRGYAIYTAGQEQSRPSRLALAADLRQALGRRELVLEYLPVVNLQAHTLWGLEVLLRWRHPRHGAIAADQFMATAEQIGLVDTLTWWTLETALRRREDWTWAGRYPRLAMPLSLHTLFDPRLPTSITRLLAQYDYPPEMLILELAGESLSEHTARATAMLARLAEIGVCLTIRGLSSPLAAIGPLPIQAVTIAPSLIRAMRDGTPAQEAVRAIVEQCHDHGARVVAEGVADQQTWDLLLRLHADRARGPYVAGPVAAADLERWLASTRWGKP